MQMFSLEESSTLMPEAILREWLDLDAAITRYCTEHGLIEPAALPERLTLHIKVIDTLLELDIKGGRVLETKASSDLTP